MSTVKEHQSVTVPRLNLKLLGSKSAPNSARSTKSEEKIKNRKPKINSTNTKLRTEEGRCDVQRREFKPVHVRTKTPLRMTKSLTVDTGLCVPIEEDEELICVSEHNRLSDLDELVIDTSLNISNKLCISAGHVINQASSKLHDNKLLDDVETLSYILDDTNQTNEDPSHQLAVLLKNLKKIEQAFELTKSIMRQKENRKV